MTANSVIMEETLPDNQLLEELGASLRRERLARNLSQAELGNEAGTSRDTVRRMEAGEPVSTLSLVRMLRVLGLAGRLSGIAPARGPGPLEQLEKGPAGRQRARASKSGSEAAAEWRWAEEDGS